MLFNHGICGIRYNVAIRVKLCRKFTAFYYMILIFYVQFVKVPAPAPDSHNQVGVFFRVLLRVEENFSVDGVYLKLMSAHIYEKLYEGGGLFYAYVVSEHGIVNFKRKRSAVDYIRHIVFGKRGNDGKQTVGLHAEAR